MRALIIEDQFLISAQIEDDLREMGFSEFDFVEDQKGALRAASENCPDLITADQRIINGSGVEAVAAVCAEYGDIPTVFITGFPLEVRQALPNAVVVAKPFGSTLLKEAVAQAIVNHRRLAETS